MTTANVAPLILKLAIPTTLSMLVTSVYNLADTAFVGRLGTSASGAVGVVFSFMAIIQAFGFLFGQGAGALVSRLLGKRDVDEASVVASTGFFMAIGFGTILALGSFLALDPLIRFMGSTETIAPYAKTYISFILLATPFTMAGFGLNQILRFEGKATLSMVGMMSGCILNIFGDMLFMFVLDMGIAGAGLSTALSEFVSFCILLSMFLTGKSLSHLSPRLVSFDAQHVLDICATGLPSLLRQGLIGLTTMLLNSQAAVYGDPAVAAVSIVGRVIFFAFSLALGIGQGFQPVCGFNFGAGKYSRVRQAMLAAAGIGTVIIFVAQLPLSIFPAAVVQLFRDDPEVIQIGARALRLQGLALVCVPFSVVTEMTYQCTGHKLGASALSLLRGGLIFIPILLLLAHFRGLAGIQEAHAVNNLVVTIPSAIFLVHFLRTLPTEDEESEPKPTA